MKKKEKKIEKARETNTKNDEKATKNRHHSKKAGRKLKEKKPSSRKESKKRYVMVRFHGYRIPKQDLKAARYCYNKYGKDWRKVYGYAVGVEHGE